MIVVKIVRAKTKFNLKKIIMLIASMENLASQFKNLNSNFQVTS